VPSPPSFFTSLPDRRVSGVIRQSGFIAAIANLDHRVSMLRIGPVMTS
jgi:hypothetical protein